MQEALEIPRSPFSHPSPWRKRRGYCVSSNWGHDRERLYFPLQAI